MFVATKKCLIELDYNWKVSDRIKLQLDSLVATDMIFLEWFDYYKTKVASTHVC
jgi:hypothetical protein